MEDMSQSECIGSKEKVWVLNAKSDWSLVGIRDERVLNNKMETLEGKKKNNNNNQNKATKEPNGLRMHV